MPPAGPITNKAKFYQWHRRDAFGNRLRDWQSLTDLRRSGFSGMVGVRSTLATGFKAAAADNVSAGKLPSFLASHGLPDAGIVISEGAPDERQTIQGEVSRQIGGLVLRYNTEKVKMRPAMERASHAFGLTADGLLRKHLSPPSYDDLMELLDCYEDHIVEFTAFSGCVGWARGRNCVVWEVRKY
jgi:hypothetical protein